MSKRKKSRTTGIASPEAMAATERSLEAARERMRHKPQSTRQIMRGANALSDEWTHVYLNVPYDRKEYAKQLGARWDPALKKWWCYPVLLPGPLEEFV